MDRSGWSLMGSAVRFQRAIFAYIRSARLKGGFSGYNLGKQCSVRQGSGDPIEPVVRGGLCADDIGGLWLSSGRQYRSIAAGDATDLCAKRRALRSPGKPPATGNCQSWPQGNRKPQAGQRRAGYSEYADDTPLAGGQRAWAAA